DGAKGLVGRATGGVVRLGVDQVAHRVHARDVREDPGVVLDVVTWHVQGSDARRGGERHRGDDQHETDGTQDTGHALMHGCEASLRKSVRATDASMHRQPGRGPPAYTWIR